ncbi:ATP-dependent RNA helicase [Nesidiocoris tenuis]|uniref:Probable ATP-dependent RNA helicase DDX52 n=2 Tax=Nesidiocoris tenuis TaxID=355587 RepID=A0ABN7B1W2_9HEMI|nr:ATP-dependent RNA helicase [Nesidiocoris tenuis]
MDSSDVLKILWKGVKSKPKHKATSSGVKNEPIKREILEHGPLKGEELKKEEPDSDEDDVEIIAKTDVSAAEDVGRFRKTHGISVKGKNIPDPFAEFEQLSSDPYSVNSHIVENLRSLGYQRPTPVQMQAIPALLQRRHVLVTAPTGSGKTAAFLVPVLAALRRPSRKGVRALILAPTRELAKQIFRECAILAAGTDLKADYVTKLRSDEGSKFSRKFDLLISTPNRLVHVLRNSPDLIDLSTVEWLIVDESDKLFEAGMRGFRDQLAEIYKLCDNENLVRGMFSATYTVHVERWCRKNLKKLVEINAGTKRRNTTVDSVDQELIYVGTEAGKLGAFRNLIIKGFSPPALVFVQSKDRAKQLFDELLYDGINVDVIHADRTQQQRDNVVRAFREGKIWVLICTDVLGRGVDFCGVKLVVNYDFPTSAISYVHRVGRTGRAGMRGRAVTFFTNEDRPALRSIARVMKDSGCPVPEYMLTLKDGRRKDRPEGAPVREDISTSKKLGKRKSTAAKSTVEKRKKLPSSGD